MQNQNKTFIIILLVFILCPVLADARSGCCSHHGGVCGCGCCDGTALSSTCAPYYPQCNSKPSSNYSPPITNYTPLPTPTPIPRAESTSQMYKAETESTGNNNDTFDWLWLPVIAGGGGYLYYRFAKRKN